MAFAHLALNLVPVSQPRHATSAKKRPHPAIKMTLDRRQCLKVIATGALALYLPSAQTANAAMYSAETKTDTYAPKGDLKKIEAYMPQIEAGYEAMRDLEKNWVAKTRDYDGDVVRRILGTVGVTSPLFNIRKTFLKAWQIVAETSTDDELIERLESEWNDVLNGISSVDFQLYSVSFTELTESKESLIKQGKIALEDTIAIYSDLLKDLNAAI